MKKILLLFSSSALLLLAGCAKESSVSENKIEDGVSVCVEAGIDNYVTKAVSDNDGHGKKVDHWVMEVRDAGGNIYTREERNNVAAGTKEQTFYVTLVKGSSYSFQFWADTKGAYKTDSLTAVVAADTVANKDTRDAFSANVAYTPSMGKSLTATLKRPFAQLNIQSTDLEKLWETTQGATSRTEYDRFEPKDLKISITVPKAFNVKTQSAEKTESAILTAKNVHTSYQSDSTTLNTGNNFYNHANPATFFMDYIFAGKEKGLFDIQFSFTSNENNVAHSFTSIPLQRNYRTNIKGALLTDDTEWTVTIDPEWEEPDYEK